VRGTPDAFADGVREILARPESERRAAARARAERFGWPQAVEGFLRAHGLPPATAAAATAEKGGRVARQQPPMAALRPAVPGGGR
jgi:alpha-1,6-mannosyltransferase